ncbi:GNAT family N-acetyltransferase [Chitinophaga sp. GCM10012297]|uniref:N-acetyltransferase n=1 Tax=Chitinophaga chungangae TaxID=2821488 RepID=A0ABS3YBI6_9BACT|nr:N-acetyltransferase [Chitinophaga chungangae]MBO9152011.1 N-acetyltransferase [Chitinophaga chungangae]
MKIIIQPETPEDRSAIYSINAAAFGQENESRLIDLLRDSEHFIPELSLVARADNGPVGHILFTRLIIAGTEGVKYPALALAPMAVLPSLQQSGIGSQLVREGLKRATELGYGSVIVLGHPQYYPKFGFAPASRWGIRTAYEVPDEVFMAIELEPGALEGRAGVVVYPDAFGAV